MPSSGPRGYWRQTCGSFKRDECSLATQSLCQRLGAPEHLIRGNWVERASLPRVGLIASILFCCDFLRVPIYQIGNFIFVVEFALLFNFADCWWDLKIDINLLSCEFFYRSLNTCTFVTIHKIAFLVRNTYLQYSVRYNIISLRTFGEIQYYYS